MLTWTYGTSTCLYRGHVPCTLIWRVQVTGRLPWPWLGRLVPFPEPTPRGVVATPWEDSPIHTQRTPRILMGPANRSKLRVGHPVNIPIANLEEPPYRWGQYMVIPSALVAASLIPDPAMSR